MSCTGASGRAADRTPAALWVLVAAAGIVAFVFAPGLLAGTRAHTASALVGATGDALAGYWGAGAREFSPALSDLVDYWQRYHLIKAGSAGIVLAAAVVVLSGHGRLGRLVTALFTVVAGAALTLLVANIQGAVAPFASLLSMAPLGRPDIATAARGFTAELAGGSSPSPTLAAMSDDFTRYHVALVVLAGAVAALMTAGAVIAWRRSRRGWAVLYVSTAAAAAVLMLANVSTAVDPGPALMAFFG